MEIQVSEMRVGEEPATRLQKGFKGFGVDSLPILLHAHRFEGFGVDSLPILLNAHRQL